MAWSASHHVFDLDDYFDEQRSTPRKLEFSAGRILLMAGGSPRHNYLAQRFQQLIANQLGMGPCAALSSDQRIATADGLYTYADGSVFCGEMQMGREQTATNPTVLLEVLSDRTRAYDRGEKLTRYQSIASLQHVVLVEPDGMDVEVWSRTGDVWSRAVFTEGDQVVPLPAIGVRLEVRDLYAGADRLPAG